jgi:hypothetical protein
MSIALAMLAASSPIEVAQNGFTWGSILISVVSGGGFASVLLALVKIRPTLKKLAIDGDSKLREDLMAQLKSQGADHSARVARLETRLDEQRAMYEARIDYERVAHASELTVMRHRMNNLDSCLTMLLTLIEENPSKAQAAAKRAREMRADQEARESAEKATIAAAQLAAASIRTPPTGSPPPPTP